VDRVDERNLFQIWQGIYASIVTELGKDADVVNGFFKIVDPMFEQIFSLEQNRLDSSQGELLIKNLEQLKVFLKVNQCTAILHAVVAFNAVVQQKIKEIATTATSSTALSVPMSQGYHSLFDVPVEVITTRVMSYLQRSDIESLVRTCKTFFHSNPQRQVIRDNVVARKVFTGRGRSFVVNEQGDVFAFGANAHGELGLGHRNSVRTPQQVQLPEGKKIQDIAVATKGSLFLFTDGTLYVCGLPAWQPVVRFYSKMAEFSSDLLRGKAIKAIAAHEDAVLILCADNTLFAAGCAALSNKQLQQIAVPQGGSIQSLAIGANHMMVLGSSGHAYALGYNHVGQLGIGCASNEIERQFKLVILPGAVQVKAIAVGARHSMLLAADNTLYTCGANDTGQRGVPMPSSPDRVGFFAKVSSVPLHAGKQPKAIVIAGNSNFVIYTDGTLCVFGECRSTLGKTHTNVVSPTIVQLGAGERVQDLAAVSSHVLFADTKGVIRASGLNHEQHFGAGLDGWLDKPAVIVLPEVKPAEAQPADSADAAPPKSDNCVVM